MYEIIGGSFSLKQVSTVSVTELFLRIDGKFTASILLLIKSSFTLHCGSHCFKIKHQSQVQCFGTPAILVEYCV